MLQEKWESIKGNVKDKFKVNDSGFVRLDDEGGIEIEYIEFYGPLGLIRLEFVTKPVILDKKTTYSKRIASETKIDYIYSNDEKSSKIMVYKWDEVQNDWTEINGEGFLK